MQFIRTWLAVVLACFILLAGVTVQAQEQPQSSDDSLAVMQVFNDKAAEELKAHEISDKQKHKILFFMGLGLLILLCTTAYFGVSMVVFNKEVFVPHMISAGLTVTLGLAHAVAAVVWFFPF